MRLLALHFLIILLSLKCITIKSTTDEDTIGYAGMVSSTHYLASEAGKKILLMGGTAADAAVAVQMVLNIVQPYGTGIGGGAFIMYYDASTDKIVAIDGREEAPNAYNPYIFCANISCYNSYKNNKPLPFECRDCEVISWPERSVGGLSVGTPGTLYAFKRLWELFGAGEDIISWSDLFTDAIHIGENGFKMYDTLYNYINSQLPYLMRYNSTCKLLLNYPYCNQSKYDINDIVYNKQLSNTFKILSSNANDAINEFYNGTIGLNIINTIQNAYNNITKRNGLLTGEDLSNYRAVFREPISNTIELNNEKYEIYGMNMPSSGPATVQYELKLLENLLKYNDNNLDLKLLKTNRYSSDALHYLFSIGNIAFADRNQYMADNDFINVPIDGMQDDKYLRNRSKVFLNDRVQEMPVPYGYPIGWNESTQSETIESGTAHINIVDRFGNIVSITSTIEGPFGARIVVDGYGFFLNNELTDFSAKGMVNNTRVANGAQGGKRKRISAINLYDFKDSETYGGKRPRSSMSPMIVFKNEVPYLSIGGRGGASIISNVFNIIVRHLLYDVNIQRAINDARIYSFNLDNGQLRFEELIWENVNDNITNRMVNKFGYDRDNLLNYSYGSCNGIVIDEYRKGLNMLYCGSDYTRRPMERCSAVCNSTDSRCPFAITTMYPETTNDINYICDALNEYEWIIKIEIINCTLINSDRMLIGNSLKRVFFNSIYKSLNMEWLDEFCYDLMDKELVISDMNDRYGINGTFQYNNNLQNKMFSNDSLFNMFSDIFNRELIDILIENEIINNSNDNMNVIINDPSKYTIIPSDKTSHKMEWALIIIIVIILLINVIVFVCIILYVVKNTKNRVDIDGDIDWNDARKKYKLPYWIVVIEISNSIIHWIFAIIVITYESYLGWILVALLLIAEIILYTRYILYKQLILYQIPQILKQNDIEIEMKQNEIIARRIDIGLFGVLLSNMEDIPIIIAVIIIAGTFGLNIIEIISLVTALLSIGMKIILLVYAKYGSVNYNFDIKESDETNLVNNNEQMDKEAIELNDHVNDENEQEEQLDIHTTSLTVDENFD